MHWPMAWVGPAVAMRADLGPERGLGLAYAAAVLEALESGDRYNPDFI